MARALPEERPSSDKLVALLVNSTATYLLAYLIVHVIVQGAEILVAYQYRIHSIWNLSRLDFLIPDPDWRRSAVILTYSVGQTICMLLGIISFLLLQRLNEGRGLGKVFAAWLCLHGFNQFFGAMASDNFLHEGFWYSPRWLFWHSNIPVIGLGFLFANICLLIGYRLSMPFLKTCESRSLLRMQNRGLLIMTLIFGPWVFGTALIELLKFPGITWLERSHQLSMLLLLIPLAIGVRFQMHDTMSVRPRPTTIAWRMVMLTLVVMLLFRGIFQTGRRFDPVGWPEHRIGF